MIKRLLPFIFATALGIVAVLVMQWHIGRQRRALDLERKKLYATYQAPIEVIVAKQDLPEGTTLAKEHLALRSIPRNFIQPYATTQAVEVLGLVTRAPMAEGEQVLRNKLQRPEEAVLVSSLSRVTPEGMRAVTIGTDALTGVGGFVRPGDVVDILWSFQLPGPDAKAKKEELVTVTLFQGVKVLAVGNQMMGAPGTKEQEPSRDYTVTLALTPEQTQVLLFAREQGRVELSLRPQTEGEEQVAIPPAHIRMLIGAVLGSEAVQEQPEAAPPRTVEVFKGLERSVVSLNE